MQNTLELHEENLGLDLGLDLDVSELEALEAPGFWSTAGGVAGGVVIGYGTVLLFAWT